MDYSRWVTANYEIVNIKDMTTLHITNAIIMIKSGKQKNGLKLSQDWINNQGYSYLCVFEDELEQREILIKSREAMSGGL